MSQQVEDGGRCMSVTPRRLRRHRRHPRYVLEVREGITAEQVQVIRERWEQFYTAKSSYPLVAAGVTVKEIHP